jgi:hypothetical protein
MGRLVLSQRLAFEFQAVGVVNQPIQNGIGDGGLVDQFVNGSSQSQAAAGMLDCQNLAKTQKTSLQTAPVFLKTL